MRKILFVVISLLTASAQAQNYLRDDGIFHSVVEGTASGNLLGNSVGMLSPIVVGTGLNLSGGVLSSTFPAAITALTGDVTATGPGAAAATLTTAQPGVHTWALTQTFTSAPVFSDQYGSRSALGLGSAAVVNVPIGLSNGGLGGSQTGATEGQVPIMNSSGTAYVPGGFTAPYSGAVARTINSKMADIVSVFDFIPVNLQAAIKAGTSTTDVSSYLTAMQASVPVGVAFFFPSGQYNIGAASIALTGRVIYATGASFTGGGSVTGALGLIGQNSGIFTTLFAATPTTSCAGLGVPNAFVVSVLDGCISSNVFQSTDVPTVLINRTEKITGSPLVNWTAALQIISEGASGTTVQNNGIQVSTRTYGIQDSCGICVAAYSYATLAGKSAFGIYLDAEAKVANVGAQAVAVNVVNATGTSQPYSSTNSYPNGPTIGIDLNLGGTGSTGLLQTAGVIIRTAISKTDVGIGFPNTGPGINTATIVDDANAPTSLLIRGIHTGYGADFNDGTFASGVIRIPNSSPIFARNAANNADINVIAVNSSNQISIGTTSIDMVPGSNSTQNFGSALLPWATIYGTIIDALTGFQVNGAATSGYVLRGNGTNFVNAQLSCEDLSNSGTGCKATIANYLPLSGGTMVGNLLFTDNTYDIGASNATSPRSIYLASHIYLRDTTALHSVVFGATSTSASLTADRALTFDMGNVAHIITLGTTANTGSGIIFPNSATDTVAMLGVANSFSQPITSTVSTGAAPFVVASTTQVANLNVSKLEGNTWEAPGTIGGTTKGQAYFSKVSINTTNTTYGLNVEGNNDANADYGVTNIGMTGSPVFHVSMNNGHGAGLFEILASGTPSYGIQFYTLNAGSGANALNLNSTGTVTMPKYTEGVAKFDSSGNITSIGLTGTHTCTTVTSITVVSGAVTAISGAGC